MLIIYVLSIPTQHDELEAKFVASCDGLQTAVGTGQTENDPADSEMTTAVSVVECHVHVRP